MQTITEIIKPISLLKGSHKDTAQTGSGCFMNVIAYLNGEPQITDQSPCVCVTVRSIAIWFNDFLRDDERGEMIPFIERAMGSATNDEAEISRRLGLMVKFAERQRDIAKSAANAANSANAASYASYATSAASYASSYASAYASAANAVNCAAAASAAASYATSAANEKFREQIKAATLEFLDAALPKAVQPTGPLIERAKSLVACASH